MAFLFAAPTRNARLLTGLAALAIAVSGAIGVFHAGVEYGWWEGLTRCASGGPMTLEDIMSVPLVRCDEVQFKFLTDQHGGLERDPLARRGLVRSPS